MTEAVVSFALEKLGHYLFGNPKDTNLHEVKGDVDWLQNELRFMRAFLKDAEQKQDGGERLQVWASDIRDIADDAEAIIKTYALSLRVDQLFRNSKRGIFSTYLLKDSPPKFLHVFHKKIEAIKRRVLEVTRRRELYGINYNIGPSITTSYTNEEHVASFDEGGDSSCASTPRDLRLTTSYTNEDHVVDLEALITTMIRLHEQEELLPIISSIARARARDYGWEGQPPPSIVSPAATSFGTTDSSTIASPAASARSSNLEASSVSSTASP